MLKSKEVSAVELLDAHLRAVVERNSSVNAVVTMQAEVAMVRAGEIDALRSKGEPAGALAGLPMTVKDSLMTKGMRTTSGATELEGFVPDNDADVVAHLRMAGAVIYGKSNLPTYANDVQTYNSVFGTSNNPWDLERSVGGSSGGSAAAVASGLSALEIGSDIAGSIRNPASMCGVVGHKPSYGIVSARGQIPGPPGTLTQADLAVVGPLARSADDCALALEQIIGPDSWMETAWSLALPQARHRSPKGLRVAVLANHDGCPVDPEIETAILGVAAELEAVGSIVDYEAQPVDFDFAKAERTFWNLLGGALSGGWSLAELEDMANSVAAGDSVNGDLGIVGASQRHRAWLSDNERRLQMRARWKDFFDDWDIVLAPVAPTVAIPHDHHSPASDRTVEVAGQTRPYQDLMSWMGIFGMSYLPATAVPIGLHSSGLPMGLQVVGPFLEDYTALGVASMIEEITGGTQRPPMFANQT